MKDKIVRAKETIQRHRTRFAFGAGVFVGAGVVIGALAKASPPEIWLTASPEMLQRLLDESTGAMTWTHTHGAVVNVVNGDNPLFQ